MERIRDAAPILRRVVFAFHGYARRDVPICRPLVSFVRFFRSFEKKGEGEREKRKTNPVTGRTG